MQVVWWRHPVLNILLYHYFAQPFSAPATILVNVLNKTQLKDAGAENCPCCWQLWSGSLWAQSREGGVWKLIASESSNQTGCLIKCHSGCLWAPMGLDQTQQSTSETPDTSALSCCVLQACASSLVLRAECFFQTWDLNSKLPITCLPWNPSSGMHSLG